MLGLARTCKPARSRLYKDHHLRPSNAVQAISDEHQTPDWAAELILQYCELAQVRCDNDCRKNMVNMVDQRQGCLILPSVDHVLFAEISAT